MIVIDQNTTVRLVKTVLNCYKLAGNESNPESNKLNYPL